MCAIIISSKNVTFADEINIFIFIFIFRETARSQWPFLKILYRCLKGQSHKNKYGFMFNYFSFLQQSLKIKFFFDLAQYHTVWNQYF